MAFAAAPFWALMASPPRDAAHALLDILIKPSAASLIAAVPPWLPFLTFVSLLSAPLATGARNPSVGDSESWAWSGDVPNGNMRAQLESFVGMYLQADPSSWLNNRADWLSECLRGLCDRLAKVFAEEAYYDKLLAKSLWAFAVPAMPVECRAVCWGAEDSAVVGNLSRSLLTSDFGPTGAVQKGLQDELASMAPLLWPVSSYLGPGLEDKDVLERASEALARIGTETRPQAKFGDAGSVPGTPRDFSSWPAFVAARQLARYSDVYGDAEEASLARGGFEDTMNSMD